MVAPFTGFGGVCTFLLKGQWANARSVWEAYRAFRKLKKNILKERETGKISVSIKKYCVCLFYQENASFFGFATRVEIKIMWKVNLSIRYLSI